MCAGCVVHGPWLSDRTPLATRHQLQRLSVTHSAPCAAGRCSFIICDTPTDSPAQGWDHSCHGQLLTPSPFPRIRDRVLPTCGDLQSPLHACINARSSGSQRPRCADTQGPGVLPLAVGAVYIQDEQAEKQVFSFLESSDEAQNCWPCSGRGLG